MSGDRHRARPSFGHRSWSDTFSELSAARQERGLEAAELEQLAVSAYVLGRDDDCETAWMDAYTSWLSLGEAERAASCAFWHAIGLFFRGDLAPAMGWVARGRRLLEGGRPDSVEHAWLSMLTALPLLFGGDTDAALPSFAESERIARRLGDADAATFAMLGRGYGLVSQGQVGDGMALLDEVTYRRDRR